MRLWMRCFVTRAWNLHSAHRWFALRARLPCARDLWEQIGVRSLGLRRSGRCNTTARSMIGTLALQDGRINASNPCSEYMFLDDTACNLASLNLLRVLRHGFAVSFKIDDLMHAVQPVDDGAGRCRSPWPSSHRGPIAQSVTTITEPSALGYANLGALLMVMGLPYDSVPGAQGHGGHALLPCLTAEAYATSARMASELGPFAALRCES